MTPKTTALFNSDLISIAEDVTTLVGVIDLMNGKAVHAVKGQRHQYQPVEFCSGDPAVLLDHYVRLGIRRFYVADLDAITSDEPNADQIARLASNCDEISDCNEIIFDLGWRGHGTAKSGDLTERVSRQFSHCQWIAATEALPNPTAISELADLVGPERSILSLDYRHGRLLSESIDEQEWILAAITADVRRFLVLDLASVGSDHGPTTAPICERIASVVANFQINSVRRINPKTQLYSGGGIRSRSDIDTLSAAGCNHILLATALYPQEKPKRQIS